MYERTYLDVFERLADMVAQSAFPYPDEDVGTEEAPRVGDGVVVVDADGRVEFASPNAMNAFHRMGIYAPPEGRRFGDLDIEETAIEWALANGRPVVEEVERRPDVIVLLHIIPLLSHGVVTGAMILLRDVTDVRRLDRLLLSKDAAIREVHHRVKNNLQTISSLLSLQARRVDERAARVALHEAERRVRSISLVHEILSRDPSDQVPFAEIVVSLVQMAEDSVVSSQPIVDLDHGRPGGGGGGCGHPAGGHPGRAPPERRGARLRPRAGGGPTGPTGPMGRTVQPVIRRWVTWTLRSRIRGPSWSWPCGTTVRVSRRASTSRRRPASGSPSCATWWPASSKATSPWRRFLPPRAEAPVW